MKRYIRLKDGQIIDTEHKDTDKYLIERILKDSVIAESDYVYDLAQVGDLYSILLLIDMGEAITEETYEIANDNDLADFKENVKLANFIFNKLYTKQDGNYIQVWNRERGVI